jgi:hypothetical protein
MAVQTAERGKVRTAEQAYRSVRESVEKIDNSKPQRFPAAASPGDNVRQGDIYITLLEKRPSGLKLQEHPEAKLTPGNTLGSQHVLDSLVGVKQYVRENASPIQGPILELTEERTVTHPQHGHWILNPGLYEVTYQKAYADELKRRQD